MLTWIDWLMIAGYFALLGGVVVFTMMRQKIQSGEDLFLGGRSVGWLAIGASIFAANIGSEHLIGLAGSGAAAGLSQAHWELHAWVLVMMSWVFLPFYYKSGVSTMPEFLERRFGARARWILSLVSLAAYVLTKISVTVFAGALFFEVMMPEVQLTIGGTTITSFWIGAIATVILAGVYSSIGGLSAVVYTDLVQTGIILAGTLSVTAFALYHLGNSGVALADGSTAQGMLDGWAVLKQTIKSTGNVEQFGLWHSLTHKTFPWLGVAIASATIGVWYWCTDQFIIQRTLAAKNLTNARRGAIWGGALKLCPVFLFLVPGMLGFALWQNNVKIGGVEFQSLMYKMVDGAKVIDGDKVFPTLVQNLLPVGFRGLVVAGMIAALMSSLASLFNSVSTLFTVDVYQKLKPDTPQRKLVTIGRTTTVVMTALGLLWLPIMKAIAGGGLYQYIQAVQSFLAPPIVAVFVMGLAWKRMNLRGAVWGLSLGFILGMCKLGANIIWGGADGFAFIQDFYFSGILLAVSILIVVVASLTAPAPDAAHTTGLTFAGLDPEFKKENRASWNWIDVLGSTVVVGCVVAAYAYFWTWLD
ncbi:MAG: sodium/solute symporter [Lentisphaerae bacterium]|nr:sodium/solute symporter [Lentisphaerota bacterium]